MNAVDRSKAVKQTALAALELVLTDAAALPCSWLADGMRKAEAGKRPWNSVAVRLTGLGRWFRAPGRRAAPGATDMLRCGFDQETGARLSSFLA